MEKLAATIVQSSGCTMVDIGSPSDLAAAIDEILAYHPEKMIENEIAFRKGTRYVKRIYHENKGEQAVATGRHVNHCALMAHAFRYIRVM